jgi:predicted aspartyl protease
MMARFAYDTSFDPPAPLVPVRVSGPAGDEAVMVAMFVDTGADCTLLPAALVRRLRLPRVGVVEISAVGGIALRATKHAAVLELGKLRRTTTVAAFHDEAILGRDVLNQIVTTLDGPGRAISMQDRAGVKHERRRRGDGSSG